MGTERIILPTHRVHMFDPHMVTRTAKEAVRRFGTDAVVFSRDQVEVARALGDAGSALAWVDIANAVERLIRTHSRSKANELAAAD